MSDCTSIARKQSEPLQVAHIESLCCALHSRPVHGHPTGTCSLHTISLLSLCTPCNVLPSFLLGHCSSTHTKSS